MGADSSCGLLIEITDTGATVYGDPTQGPYDGIEDTLIGVVNDSTRTMGALALTSSTDLFGFDGDGLCAYTACTWSAPTGYEGPNTAFSDISPDYASGVVNFPAGLAAGSSTYFSLEESLSTSNVSTGSGQSAVTAYEVGQTPNPRELLQDCSTGQPINCATGVFWHTFEDLSIPGRGPALDFQRSYSSLLGDTDSLFGFGWSSPYSMNLSITASDVTVHQENGSTIDFAVSGSTYTAPSRVLASLVKNVDGTYTLTDFRGGTQHTFSSTGQLLSVRDRNGETTTLTYTSGVLSGVTDPAGRTVSVTTDASGHATKITDPTGRTVSFGYDAAGNLTGVTDVRGGTWGFGYDGSHRMLTMTDPRGGTVTNTYDTSGRVTSQTDQMGRTTTLSFAGDPTTTAGGTTTITDPRGKVTLENYQQLQLQSITRGSGTAVAATTTYSYDPFTLGIASRTDPNGHTTTFSYDRRGNLLSSTDPLGRATTMTWNGLNEPTSSTDPAGHATTYGYDSTGNLVSVAKALSSTVTQATQFQHSNTAHPGDVTGLVDPDSNLWTYAYDAAGDLTGVTDPTGDTTHAGYDPIGRRTSSTSGRGNTTNYVYDPADEMTKVTDPAGGISLFGYNANGNQTSTTDADGNNTTTSFDADGEPVTVTRADSSTLSFGYDDAGNQLSQTNGANKTTTYGYDALNRVVSVTDPLGRTTSYDYDGAGNRTRQTNPGGGTISYGFDAADELTSVDYSDSGTPDVSYAYTTTGLRQQMTDGTGTSSYTYDALDRLVTMVNGVGQTVGYGYDLANRVTALTYPNNQSVTRGYDPAGRLTSVTDWNNHTSTFGYDADGAVTGETLANGVTATTSRDVNGQITGITDTAGGSTLASFGYTRDANSQVTGETSTGVGQPAQAYTYNPLNQLASRNASAYSYNAADNLVRLATGAQVGYDAADEATSYTDPTGAQTTFGFDQRGNRLDGLTSDGSTKVTYGYDQANRLTSTRVQGTGSGQVLAAGDNHSVALLADGTVKAWGLNTTGQLGDGTNTSRSTPVTVTGLSGIVAVAAGGQFSLALDSNGTVWAWGANAQGQLGDGTTTERHTPVQVVGLPTITAIAAGRFHGLAVGADGSVWAWGGNKFGQIGDSTTTDRPTPRQVAGITGATAVAGGEYHSLALRADGTVVGWGANYDGQLGNNAIANIQPTPVQASGLTGATRIAAGWEHSLAITTDGAVWTWGNNKNGQLGDGTSTDHHIPEKIAAAGTATAVSGGDNFSLAADTDGTVKAWGSNANGQLSGTSRSSQVPITVTGISTGTTVAAGDEFSLAGLAAGSVKGWGYNHYGQLGNGTTTSTSTPVTAAGVSTLAQPGQGIGAQTTYAYDGDGLRVATAGGSAHQFAWDHAGATPLLLTDGSNYFVYGPDNAPVEQINVGDGIVQYICADQYGSTRLLTSSSGAVVGTLTYSPYGSLESRTGTADTPLRWNGQYQDAQSGLYYLRARYYDAQIGGFLTRDPLAGITGHRYSYASNDPLDGSDPLGLICLSAHCLLHDVATVTTWVQTGTDVVAAGSAAVGLEPVAGVLLGVSETVGVVNVAATCADALTGAKDAASWADCGSNAVISLGTAGVGRIIAPGRIGRLGKQIYDWDEYAARGGVNAFGDLLGWERGWKLGGTISCPAETPPQFSPAP